MKPIPIAEINRKLTPKDPLEQAQFGAALFEKCRLAHNAEPKTPEGKQRRKTLWLPKIRAACKLIAEARILLPWPDKLPVDYEERIEGMRYIRFDKRAFLSSDIGAKQLGLIDIGKSFEKTPIHDTPDVDPLEDFTTYTEVDPDNRFTITSSQIDVYRIEFNDSDYVYKDYGIGCFRNFTHRFSTRLYERQSTTSFSAAGVWGVSNVIGTAIDWWNQYAEALSLMWFINYNTPNTVQLCLRDYTSRDSKDDLAVVNFLTDYYLTMERINTTMFAYIYTDTNRTNLLDTLSMVISASTTYRYIFPVQSIAVSDNTYLSYILKDLDLQFFSSVWAEGINAHHF